MIHFGGADTEKQIELGSNLGMKILSGGKQFEKRSVREDVGQMNDILLATQNFLALLCQHIKTRLELESGFSGSR